MVLATTTQGLATTSNDVSNESGLITINEIVLENTQADGFIPGNNVTSVGSVSYHDALKVETGNKEITIKLFPTFDYPQQALNNIASDVSSILNEMRFTYNLPTFDANSWEMYYNKIPDYETIIAGNSIKESQTAKLSAFMDIYENNVNNAGILNALTEQAISKHNDTFNIDSASMSKLALLLPDEGYKELVDNNICSLLSPPIKTTAFNKSNAIDYASTWATGHNTTYKKYDNDCTNFASQIKRAGGTNMVFGANDSVYQGWWFKYNSGARISSRSWRIAHVFKNYFGHSWKGASFRTFSEELSSGKVIGYDKTNDGDCDHVGFVTDTGILRTTEGVTYYNFKVAQHTTDYHLWVHNANNGWDKLHKNYSNIRYLVIK